MYQWRIPPSSCQSSFLASIKLSQACTLLPFIFILSPMHLLICQHLFSVILVPGHAAHQIIYFYPISYASFIRQHLFSAILVLGHAARLLVRSKSSNPT